MKNKKVILSFMALLPVLFVWGFVKLMNIGKILYQLAISRSSKDKLMEKAKSSSEFQVLSDYVKRNGEQLQEWENQTPQKTYHILSHDKVPLFGTVFLQPDFTHKWAVVVHGYNGYGCQMNFIAKGFYQAGFNVLTPDLRGHGNSGGNYIGMGWHDRLDIINWLDKIIKGDKDCEIVLYGLSMGAATVIMASGEKTFPAQVRCIIEDCGYTSVLDEFKHHMKNTLKMPYFPLLQVAGLVCRSKAGYGFYQASALRQIRKCKTPILFIHGEKDNFVPTEMVYRLYRATKCKKDLLIVEEAGHGVSANIAEKIYWKKVYSFVNQHINGEKWSEVS